MTISPFIDVHQYMQLIFEERHSVDAIAFNCAVKLAHEHFGVSVPGNVFDIAQIDGLYFSLVTFLEIHEAEDRMQVFQVIDCA